MPKDGFMQGLEKSVAKKMRGRSEDDPKFKWWKDGNRTASQSFAKENPPPKGYRVAYESDSPSGEKIVRAVKGATGRKFAKFDPESAGYSRKTVNANIRKSYEDAGQTAVGSAYNQRGRPREFVKTPTGVKFVGKKKR